LLKLPAGHASVGEAVGLALGLVVGLAVGDVGAAVGAAVGAPVGALVGVSVGALVAMQLVSLDEFVSKPALHSHVVSVFSAAKKVSA
jgi:hypothetical protein